MGIMDSLSGFLSGGSNQQPQIDKQKLSELLASISSGKGGGGAGDYAALMEAYNPAAPKRNVLSDIGDSLVQSSAANPQTDNWGTLGLALSDVNAKKKLADEKQTLQGQKSMADLMKVAGDNRSFGYTKGKDDRAYEFDKTKHADDVDYKENYLDILRSKVSGGGKEKEVKDISPNDFTDVGNLISAASGGDDILDEETKGKLTLTAIKYHKEGLDWGDAVQRTLSENQLERKDWSWNPFSDKKLGLKTPTKQLPNLPIPNGGKTIVKQFKSPSTGQTKTVYSDGTEEIK